MPRADSGYPHNFMVNSWVLKDDESESEVKTNIGPRVCLLLVEGLHFTCVEHAQCPLLAHHVSKHTHTLGRKLIHCNFFNRHASTCTAGDPNAGAQLIMQFSMSNAWWLCIFITVANVHFRLVKLTTKKAFTKGKRYKQLQNLVGIVCVEDDIKKPIYEYSSGKLLLWTEVCRCWELRNGKAFFLTRTNFSLANLKTKKWNCGQ